jgi:Zinc carboxypeptidase
MPHCLIHPRALRSLCCAAIIISAHWAPASAQRGAVPSVPPQELARIWDAEHVSGPVTPLVDHAEVVRRLDALAAQAPDLFTVEKLGASVEGRSIHHVKVGTGPTGVLLWSQMHGDESTATSALFDIFEYLRRHRNEQVVRRLLSTLTLHVVPMLNPDGAERFQRRNAQSIDINRDALRLQTPEGQLLKALRDRLNPKIGFNLHNQNWRTSVGDPPRPASISLLSVAFDEKRTESPGRKLTKKLCAVIRDSLEPFASGQIGRYDDEFEVRAFGDNITLWGTPVVLIETGPWPSATPDPALVRLNFIAIVSALDALATGQVEKADPARYETLPMNESRMFYVLVKHATVINGAGVRPYTADIGINATRRVRTTGGVREVGLSLGIDDLGDLRSSGGLRTIDASGLMAVPDRDYTEGALVDLPDWQDEGEVAIATGEPARIALLRPAAGGRYRVEVVIR